MAGNSGFHSGSRHLFALRLSQRSWDKAKARLMSTGHVETNLCWAWSLHYPLLPWQTAENTQQHLLQQKLLTNTTPGSWECCLGNTTWILPQQFLLYATKYLCPMACCFFLCKGSTPTPLWRCYFVFTACSVLKH